MTTFRVELYNLWKPFAKWPSNGWYVARLEDGRRVATVSDCKGDEDLARRTAAELSAAAANE